MKAKLILENGKELNVEYDDKEIKEDKNKFEIGERYYTIDSYRAISASEWIDDKIDNHRLLMRNAFKTREEAEHRKLCNEYQADYINWCEEKSVIVDWKDEDQEKHYIHYSFWTDNLVFNCTYCGKEQGTTYATSEKIIQDFIDKVGEENFKKYVLEV